jgi:drug/metabolite transporter (DMT)-like permease
MVRLPENTVLRAGVFMVLAMGSFVTNDTLIKLVGNSLPVGEIIMVRGVIAMAFIGLICAWQGVLGSLPLLRSRYVLLRTTLDLIATILFIMALMHMPIANITAVMQVVPLAVALLSALVLREKIGPGRMVAIIMGFVGVLLIVKPTPANFTIYDVFALLIVLAVAVRDIATRRIPARIPTFLIALANATFVTAGGAALCAVQGFTMPEAWQLGTLALAAVFLACGYLFMVTTLRLGDLSATAPFRYSIMLFAIVYGILVFGEYPDWLAISGMLLIAITGLYAAHREGRVRDSARMPVS